MNGSRKIQFLEKCRRGDCCRNLQRSLIIICLKHSWLGCYRNTGYQVSELKSSLACWFKNMVWSRISLMDMGQGSCYWLNVAKHKVIE